MTRFRSSISLKGPFFERDPARTFSQNMQHMAEAMADEAAKDVIGRMGSNRAQVSLIGGHVADRVARFTKPSGLGKTTVVVMVGTRGLSGDEATALDAAGSQVERQTHAFRKMTARMRSARAVQRAELLKGIQ